MKCKIATMFANVYNLVLYRSKVGDMKLRSIKAVIITASIDLTAAFDHEKECRPTPHLYISQRPTLDAASTESTVEGVQASLRQFF